MIGKVANRRDGKGETGFLSLSTYLDREDSSKTWTKKGFDKIRVSSTRITWCALAVSSLSRAPASVPLSAARHWAAAHMLRTSAQKERLAILLIMLHEQVSQASTTLGFVQVFARWLVMWFLVPTLLLAPVCLSHHLMWKCLSDAGHASCICALFLGDEVQDGSGENKTAPWRLQSGWGSPVVWSHDKVRTLPDRTNGCLAVQVLDRYMWNQFAFVCAPSRVWELRRQWAVNVRVNNSLRVGRGEGVWDPFLCWMATNCNNIVNVNQYLVKPAEVFLPDAKEPESELNDSTSARDLQDMWLIDSISHTRF